MKLKIRKFKEDDLIPLHELLCDDEVMRYIKEEPFSFEKTKSFLESAGFSELPLIYAVEDDNNDFIGYVIYHDYEENSKEIGWVLKKQFWRKGYANELTNQLIKMAQHDKKSVIIECSPNQKISRHIAEKNGFTYFGERDGCVVYKLDYNIV